MLAEEVKTRAETFANEWNSLFASYPRFQLDFTWPSLGTLDLLLQPVRTQTSPGDYAQNLMLGAGAYLSVIWYRFWSQLADEPKVEVQFESSTPERILLKIKGGKYLANGESVRLDLMPVLWEIIRFPRQPFPFFERTEIDLDLRFQRLPLFFLGALTGLCPYMEGPWKTKTDSDLKDYLLAAELFLSYSSADYYSRVFPAEEFGRNPTNYLQGLLLPPPHHRQASILTRPLFRIHQLQEKATEPAALQKWLKNLSLIPLQLFSLPAVIWKIAQTRNEDPSEVLPLVLSQGRSVAELRFALSFARSCLGRPGLPEVAFSQDERDEAESQLSLEIALDFFSDIFLEASEILSLQSEFLLLAICQGDPSGLGKTFSEVENPGKRVLLQAAFCYALAGEYSKAEDIFLRLSNESLPAEAEKEARLVEAVLSLTRMQFAETISLLQRTFVTPMPSTRTRVLGLRLLLSLLIKEGRFLEARQTYGKMFREDDLPIELVLDLLDMLRESEPDPEEEALVTSAIRAYPNSPIAFTALIRHLLNQRDFADQTADQ